MSPTPYCVFEYNEAVARYRKLEEGKINKDKTRLYNYLVASSNKPYAVLRLRVQRGRSEEQETRRR